MTISRTILLAFLALIAAPSHAQGLLNQPVDVTYKVSTTVYNFGTQTITPAGSTYTLSANSIMAFITPTQITYSLAPGHLGVGNNPTPFFVGYIATETGNFPSVINSVVIDPATTAIGFTPSSITFDPSDVFANFSGTNFTQGQSLVLDIASSAPIPEASTTVSFGLLLALSVSGLVIAARRKKSAPAR